MILNPDIQERAQAEIDSVVGRDRAPSFDDKEKLPYVNLIIKELMRYVQFDVKASCAKLTDQMGITSSSRYVAFMTSIFK